jgi:hypothetical protein
MATAPAPSRLILSNGLKEKNWGQLGTFDFIATVVWLINFRPLSCRHFGKGSGIWQLIGTSV